MKLTNVSMKMPDEAVKTAGNNRLNTKRDAVVLWLDEMRVKECEK